MSEKETFLVLDGNSLLHRAWHALPPLTTKDGTVVNAAYGFAMTIEKMLNIYKPDFMVVAWDLPGKTFRHEIYKEYKGHREKKEQELYDQIPIIQDLLDAYGIPSVDAEGYEADDVIATLSQKAGQENIQTLVITGDLDSLQLVDETTNVVFFQKGISQTKTYDVQAVQDRYGLTPKELVDYKALRGDPSDNIPGVPGVGEKTATSLMQEYGNLEGIFKALDADKIEEKFAKKLRGQKEEAFTSRKLVELIYDVPGSFKFSSAKVTEPDKQVLLKMFQDLEFRSLIRKYADVPEPIFNAKVLSPAILVMDDSKKIPEVLRNAKMLGVMIAEQQPDLFGGSQAAISVSDGKTTVVISNPKKKDFAVIESLLKKTNLIVTHDLKKLLHQLTLSFRASEASREISNSRSLRSAGACPERSRRGLGRDDGGVFDTMIASYLLHSGSRAHDLTSVTYKHLNKKLPELPESFATEKEYKKLGAITAALPKLKTALEKEMKKSSVDKVFSEIEMPLIKILFVMEQNGVQLDSEALSKFSKELKTKLEKLEEKIIKLAGEQFNVHSPAQLKEILFEKLSLPTKGIKKTKTGYSTAASELEKLWDKHEIIPLISKNRELAKLQSTYVEALPKLVADDERVHTTYNQTVTATGRLSSSDPNLQNIPIKTELGREIRKAFIAPKGKDLIAADYSQIELRLVAVIAKDKPFIQAFQEGADIHTRTASEVWEVDEASVTKDQRRAAKAINFGIIYGMGARSLSRSTGLSFSEAKDFIDRYFQIHHAVRDYLAETKIKAHEDGYVETMFGRRRYLPEIQSGIPMLVAQAERMAINMPVQGTAADIMKMSMIEVDAWLEKDKTSARMLMQVHDELVLECDEKDVEGVVKILKEKMEGVASFEVPLVVDVEVGKNWGEMKSI